jgi:hypothetical protein
MKVLQIDCATQEETLRDATSKEISEMQKNEKRALENAAIAEAKATARQAIADRLGLTADELAVLLG